MIIVDLQQVLIATMMQQIGAQKADVDENMLRHMALNVLRSYRVKFKGEMVLALDTGSSWRKSVFPYYKFRRSQRRDESKINWKEVFEAFNKIKAELKEFFPYRVISVDTAEADDVIGTLVEEFANKDDEFGGLVVGDQQEILIISGDHDFRQLQRYSNVKQYDPVQKKYIKVNDADAYLKEHIIKGDPGDDVPNFLSADDCFVNKVRQKQIRQEKFDAWMKQTVEEICDDDLKLRNWKRNEQLVDLRKTPQHIREQILAQYHAEAGKSRAKLQNYFIAKKLRHLHEHINEF